MNEAKAAAQAKGSAVTEKTAAEKPDGRKTRKGKKGRVMTFLYEDESGKLELVRLKTNAFSVSEAFKEAVDTNSLTNCRMVMALQGLVHQVEGDVLRKPTYDELAKLAGLTKVKGE